MYRKPALQECVLLYFILERYLSVRIKLSWMVLNYMPTYYVVWAVFHWISMRSCAGFYGFYRLIKYHFSSTLPPSFCVTSLRGAPVKRLELEMYANCRFISLSLCFFHMFAFLCKFGKERNRVDTDSLHFQKGNKKIPFCWYRKIEFSSKPLSSLPDPGIWSNATSCLLLLSQQRRWKASSLM